MMDYLIGISGYIFQNKDDPLTFEFTLCQNHTRSEEVINWLNAMNVAYTSKQYIGDKLTLGKVSFEDRQKAALFKMRFGK